jgi:hypothetical protein
MPDDNKYIPPHLRGSRNPSNMTPFDRMNYHYTTGTGMFRSRPAATPDLEPGAVRRGGGDIWSRVRDELRNIKQGTATMGRGFADAASEVGRTTGVTQFGQGAIEAGKEVGQTLQRLNLGPQGDKPWLTINAPFAKKEAAAAPGVSTVEKGAPASTYDRGEGAPAGTTRLQQQIQAGTPPAGINQRSTGNRYLDMYYAGTAAQEKFMKGLPEGQAPIQVIHGNRVSWWSPTTEKEYGTKLEAAHGVEHAPEMARLMLKEKGEAMPKEGRYKFYKLEDPKTFKETLVAGDTVTGQQIPSNQLPPDVKAVMAIYPNFMKLNPEEMDQELAKMSAKQRELLIQMVQQAGEEQAKARKGGR